MPELLAEVLEEAKIFLKGLSNRPVVSSPPSLSPSLLPESGRGAKATFDIFKQKYEKGLSGAVGPRYFGYVTGGATPASVVADWLVSLYDQNTTGFGDSIDAQIETETIEMLKSLLRLPSSFAGAFISGATLSTFVGLGLARQWVAKQHGVDASEQRLFNLPPIKVLSSSPHTTSIKALSMLGMGRSCVEQIPSLKNREAMDIEFLEKRLEVLKGKPVIVLASAGTANTGDFDDLEKITGLKKRQAFWLHVDGAFGAFAVCSPQHAHLVKGIEAADSITLDCHKWLNVPYDSGVALTQHPQLLTEVFHNFAPYLGKPKEGQTIYVHITPGGSRRFRALPAWMSLMAYGKEGYRSIVENNCGHAQTLGAWVEKSPYFRLLAPVRLNIVCFTLAKKKVTEEEVKKFLNRLSQSGKVFLTFTVYGEVPGMRAAFSNWRTEERDIAITCKALEKCLENAR